MEKTHFILDGLHCAACNTLVERGFAKKVEGVQKVNVEQHDDGTADVFVSSEGKIGEASVNKAIDGLGFKFVKFIED